MTIIDQEMLWRQFGAAIDMLGDPLRDCPDEEWEKRLWEYQPGYHALFWLDLYLSGAEEGFTPPAPFDLVEMEPDGFPPRTYARAELLEYLAYCRRKCRHTLLALTDDSASRLCSFSWGKLPYAELQLYNLRHVMEHGAQLRLFLGQQAGKSGTWVSKAR